jgi:hypothetical protein
METTIRQAQLIDHQWMQKSRKVRARRHAHAGERLFDGTSATHALAALEYQDALAGTGKVGSAGQAIVPATDHDNVPRSRSQF